MNIIQRGVRGLLWGILCLHERWIGYDAIIELDYTGGCIHEYDGLKSLSK